MEKIAVCSERGLISPYFSRCPGFIIFDTEQDTVCGQQEVAAQGSVQERAAQLAALGVSRVVCGSVSAAEQSCLQQAGIEIVPGLLGPAEMAVYLLLAGQLSYDAQATEQLQRPAQRLDYPARHKQ